MYWVLKNNDQSVTICFRYFQISYYLWIRNLLWLWMTLFSYINSLLKHVQNKFEIGFSIWPYIHTVRYNWIKNERRMQCEDKTKGLKVIFESRNNQSKILLSFSEAMFNFWIRQKNLNFNTVLGINSDVVLVFFDAHNILNIIHLSMAAKSFDLVK